MASALEGNEARPFNPETMKDVNNAEDAEALAGRVIENSLFALVHERGDERSGNVYSMFAASRFDSGFWRLTLSTGRCNHNSIASEGHAGETTSSSTEAEAATSGRR